MTELEKIKYTKNFIDKLSQGINPLDNTTVPEGELLNNVRISRCLFYVSTLLQQIIDNGGTQRIRHRKTPFAVTDEMLRMVRPSNTLLTITEVADLYNAFIDPDVTSRLSGASINRWLTDIGMLTDDIISGGRTRKRPTQDGEKLGIMAEERVSTYGHKYFRLTYNTAAQQFIIDNIEAAVAAEAERKAAQREDKNN